MATRQIHTDCDFNFNELKGVRLENRAEDPEALEGAVYYNTTLKEYRACQDGEWKSLAFRESNFWAEDSEGNLTTDRQVIINNNLFAKGYAAGQAADPSGTSGTSHSYIHIQGTASATWVITHNMDKYPSVTVVDSAGTVVHGAVNYISTEQVEVTFSSAFSGKAYLN